MSGAVVMVKRVDAVAPAAAPTVGGEDFLAGRRGIPFVQLQGATVEKEREPGIVRNTAVILQQKALHLWIKNMFVHDAAGTAATGNISAVRYDIDMLAAA